MNNTRLYYSSLRRSYRIAKRSLLSNVNAFAVCVQLTSEARNLVGKWEVGFNGPPSFCDAYTRKPNGRHVLAATNALSRYLAAN